ncbi:MAG: LytR/AlgR family response regulator transcription factor [Flavobacteriales bacterium]
MEYYLNIGLVDDEAPALMALVFMIEEYCPECGIIGSASHFSEAVELASDKKLDLLLLDYQLGSFSGKEVVDAVKPKTFDMVFVSTWADEAYKYVDMDQLDYVLKPVDVVELHTAIEKIRLKRYPESAFSGDQSKVISDKHGARGVNKENVSKIIAKGSYSELVRENDENLMVSWNLSHVERELNDPRFYRLNRSALVNLNFIESWDATTRIAILNNKDEIEISRRRIKQFEEIMTRDKTE